ncbi:hypothetical protein VFPPC_16452 [Pochonia chlamydosporia 170]|uniref:Uncharacterized protein n=1 Tax=Pochonia chlamydosporia 170 TaxID=1380566 RepID=A0A179FE07_METCM|nr:hypothetical protein VFPPC_16452 [Pochonia chlamydosporia 170]OAQ63303.1 hypothetical protein VFPPC_16452 [Pochonia chlamydosporia 170]
MGSDSRMARDWEQLRRNKANSIKWTVALQTGRLIDGGCSWGLSAQREETVGFCFVRVFEGGSERANGAM